MTPPTPNKPGHFNLTVNQGATFRIQFTWKDENGDPVDLSDATSAELVISKVQQLPGQPDVQTFLTLSDGAGLTLGDTAGTIVAEMDAATTAGFDWDPDHAKGVYDLYVSFADTTVRLLDGVVLLERQLGG